MVERSRVSIPGERPLARRSILVTRPAERSRNLVRELEALGARVDARPTIVLEPPADAAPARAALAAAASYDWIVFTSPSGVRFFFELAREASVAVARIRGAVAAIGPSTAKALQDRGIRPTLVAESSHAEGLAERLTGHVLSGRRVLLVRPEVAREVLPETLRGAGARVDAIAFYRNVPAPNLVEIARDVERGAYDVVIFTSPSTATRLLEGAAQARMSLRAALATTVVVAIGEVTARALVEAGVAPSAVAPRPSDEGIVQAVLGAI